MPSQDLIIDKQEQVTCYLIKKEDSCTGHILCLKEHKIEIREVKSHIKLFFGHPQEVIDISDNFNLVNKACEDYYGIPLFFNIEREIREIIKLMVNTTIESIKFLEQRNIDLVLITSYSSKKALNS